MPPKHKHATETRMVSTLPEATPDGRSAHAAPRSAPRPNYHDRLAPSAPPASQVLEHDPFAPSAPPASQVLGSSSQTQVDDRSRSKARAAVTRDQQRREHLIGKHLRQTETLQHPGSNRQRGASFGIHLGLGDPTGTAGIQLGATHVAVKSNDVHFTLEVDEASTRGGTGHASGSISIPGVVDAGLKGEIHVQRTTFMAYNSREHLANWKAEGTLFDEQRHARALNPLRKLLGVEQKRVHRDAEDAQYLAQRPLQGGTQSEPMLSPPVKGTIDSTRQSLQVNAGAFEVGGNYAITHYKTEVKLAAPVWIPAETLTPKQEGALRVGMEQRVLDSFAARVDPRVPPTAAERAVALFDPKRSNIPLEPTEVIDVQKELGKEFHYLNAVMKHRAGGTEIGQLQSIQNQLARDWNCTTLKDTLLRMHQTGETLLLTLDSFGRQDEAHARDAGDDTGSLEADAATSSETQAIASSREALTSILEDIRTSYGKEFGPKSLTDLYAELPMTQQIDGTRHEFTINIGPTGVNGACTFTLDTGKQKMPDPHRTGSFSELSLAANGTVSISALERTIPVLPGEHRERAAEFLDALHTPAADPTLEAGVIYAHRNFEPAYAQGALTPEGQRMSGEKLEQQSLYRMEGTSAAGSLVFPFAPGVNIGVDLGASSSGAAGLTPPVLGTDRMGRMVVHYLSLKGQTHQSNAPWDRMTAEHGHELLEMAGKLTDPGSSTHIDARFWLDRSPGKAELLKQFAETFPSASIPTSTDDPKAAAVLAALEPIFEQIGEETSAVKARSSLIEPLRLRDTRSNGHAPLGLRTDERKRRGMGPVQRTGPKELEHSGIDDMER